MTHLAARMAEIEAFHVMDILARARALEAQGRDVVHMEIGEPDFPTPDAVVEAGIAALRAGHTHYTPSLGLPALREAIAGGYPAGCQPDPSSVIVTPGSSGALVQAFGVLINPGDEVLMADPGYPCNRHFARFCEASAVNVPVDASSGFQLTLDLIERHATQATQRPLDLGADIVLSADTKVINGHSDVLLGHVASRDAALLERQREWRKLSGSIPGPFEAWLVYRGLETLEVRYERMCANASLIAGRLAQLKKVRSIRFPGLENDPAHEVAVRQMQRFGFLISLTLDDGATAERFINGCAMIQPSTSFGGVRTSAERRARWGDDTPEGFVRLAVGIEPIEPLWAAIEAALEAAEIALKAEVNARKAEAERDAAAKRQQQADKERPAREAKNARERNASVGGALTPEQLREQKRQQDIANGFRMMREAQDT